MFVLLLGMMQHLQAAKLRVISRSFLDHIGNDYRLFGYFRRDSRDESATFGLFHYDGSVVDHDLAVLPLPVHLSYYFSV